MSTRATKGFGIVEVCAVMLITIRHGCLDEDNWVHLMMRILYGRKSYGNSCNVPEREEHCSMHAFWKHEIQRLSPDNRHVNRIEEINRSPRVLEKANSSSLEHLLLCCPQFEIEEFFCGPGKMLCKRKALKINEIKSVYYYDRIYRENFIWFISNEYSNEVAKK